LGIDWGRLFTLVTKNQTAFRMRLLKNCPLKGLDAVQFNLSDVVYSQPLQNSDSCE